MIGKSNAIPKGAVDRRRVNSVRTGIVVVLTAVVLIFFVIWYRAWPQRWDCFKEAQRVAVAVEEYRARNNSFPPLLSTLSIKNGRYNYDHFEYCLTGLGGPADPPAGTLIAYCQETHQPLLGTPWRHILIFSKHHIAINWLAEKEFKKLHTQQLPAYP